LSNAIVGDFHVHVTVNKANYLKKSLHL